VATVIAIRRPRPPGRSAAQKPAAAHSAEQFWRKSMVPASIAMGAIIVLAVGTLLVGSKAGLLTHDSETWVLVAALVSVIGLTKIIVANMFFYILMQDDARLSESVPAPPPSPVRQTRPLRMAPRAIPARRPRRPSGRGRAAVLPLD
jgi:hypothetical protein